MPNCKICDDYFPSDQTIELDGVDEDLALDAFEELMEGETCAECIITDLAYKDTMINAY